MVEDYLGDGVYAEWDGYNVILRTYQFGSPDNGERPNNTICLDSYVMDALMKFYTKL